MSANDDLLGTFKKRIESTVRASQRHFDLTKLVGKTVIRNGVIFEIVGVEGKRVILSDLKTETEQTTKMSIESFLSRAVEVIGE